MKTAELEEILRGLDPARDDDGIAIVATVLGVDRPPLKRRLVLASAAGVAVLAVAAVLVAAQVDKAAGPGALRAVIGMPDPLAFTAADRRPSAADELERIAARTGELREPADGTQRIRYTGWDLWTTVGDGRTTSIVIPTRTDLVRRADGSATRTTVHTKPLLRTAADVEAWNREGRPGESERPETTTVEMFGYPGTAPPETAAMAAYLQPGHPPENGPAETLVAITDLIREQVLGPAQRAA